MPKKYVIQCRKTKRKFASTEEHILAILEILKEHPDQQIQRQVLLDRFNNMKENETLVVLVPEAIVPGVPKNAGK